MSVVRLARPSDVAEMHNMIMELAIYENAPDEVIATEEDLLKALFGGTSFEDDIDDHESMSVIRDLADTPTGSPAVYAHVIDAPDGDGLAGMAIWFLNYSTWHGKHGVYLEDLYVRERFRGQGFGKALMKSLAQVCDDNGYTRFQWWVLNWNQPAIDVYEALGAEPQSEWTVYRMSGEPLDRLANN